MARVIITVINDLTYDQRMDRTARALAAAGHDVLMIGRQLPESVPLTEKPYDQFRLQCGFLKGPQFYAEYNRKLYKKLISAEFDLVIACDLDTVLAASRAIKRKGAKGIYDAHEWFTEVPELIGRPVVRRIWKSIGRYAIPKFNACYTVGECIAGELSRVYGRRFDVVRNVPLLEDTAPVPRERRHNVVLYQGALNAGRGIEQAIKAMELLPEFALELAGEGDLSGELRKQVEEMQLGDRVRFLGKLSREVLAQKTARAIVGLNVLEASSLNYYYSLANKFFDYMHAGTPSINMDFPEYRNILSEHGVGVMIPELTADSIAAAVRSIAVDKNAWEAYHQSCLRARQIYNWQHESLILLNIVDRVIA